MLSDFWTERLLAAGEVPNSFETSKPLRGATGIGSHRDADQQLGPYNGGERVNLLRIELRHGFGGLCTLPSNNG